MHGRSGVIVKRFCSIDFNTDDDLVLTFELIAGLQGIDVSISAQVEVSSLPSLCTALCGHVVLIRYSSSLVAHSRSSTHPTVALAPTGVQNLSVIDLNGVDSPSFFAENMYLRRVGNQYILSVLGKTGLIHSLC